MFHLFSAEVLTSLKQSGLEDPKNFPPRNAEQPLPLPRPRTPIHVPGCDRIVTTDVLDVRNVLRSRLDIGYMARLIFSYVIS